MSMGPTAYERGWMDAMTEASAGAAALADKLRDIRTLCEIARVEGERLTPGEVLTIIDNLT